MRCLIIAPSHTRLDVLSKVLREEEIQAVLSVELGGGALLASAAFDDVAFAIVALPDVDAVGAGFSALLVEVGIALGRNIPTLVLTDPRQRPPAALASLPHAAVYPTDADALRMHVRVFARMAATAGSPVASPQVAIGTEPPGDDLSSENALRNAVASGHDFEALVLSLLKRSGAQVEERFGAGDNGIDARIDAAIGVPGPAGTSMVVLVEVKRVREGTANLSDASWQLFRFMAERRADLGLIVTSQPLPPAAVSDVAPMIVVISADELVKLLNQQAFNRFLINARNRAVHGA